MKIIKPCIDGKMIDVNKFLDDSVLPSIFLAGPCPRENYDDDWRQEAFKILEEIGYTGYVITPTNPEYNKMEKANALMQQTLWEYDAMHKCNVIVFWIPRSEKHPARTTNIEFGEFHANHNVFVGWPDGAIHNEYLECRLRIQNKSRYKDLKELLTMAVRKANEKEIIMYQLLEFYFKSVNYANKFANHLMDDDGFSKWVEDIRVEGKNVIVHSEVNASKVGQYALKEAYYCEGLVKIEVEPFADAGF